MRNSRAINVAAVLTILGAGGVGYFSTNEWPPTPDRPAHAALGKVIARETLQWLKPGGTVTAIIRDTEAFRHPESDAQYRGFESALQRAGATVSTLRALQVDPLRQLEVPPGDFVELVRKASAGSVVVSFMGPPVLDSDQRERLGAVKAAVIAFCPGAIPRRADLRELFEAGLLRAAMVESPVAGGRRLADQYRVVHADDTVVLEALRGKESP